MSPLATTQPQAPTGAHPAPITSVMLHGCSLPKKPCLLQSHRESSIPLPKPQILLVTGKGFPNVSLQLAGVGLKALGKSRGK